MDAVYAVYYQGSHEKSYLIITTDEAKAIEVAKSAQGFPIERWENGELVDTEHFNGSKYPGA